MFHLDIFQAHMVRHFIDSVKTIRRMHKFIYIFLRNGEPLFSFIQRKKKAYCFALLIIKKYIIFSHNFSSIKFC